MADTPDPKRRLRWRLILGEETESYTTALGSDDSRRDSALDYLYGREMDQRDIRNSDPDHRVGGLNDSELTIPEWINTVYELFPTPTVERLERDALERYKIEALVTNPDLLKRAKPSEALLRAVLRTKHLMNQNVLTLARDLVRRVVEELREKLMVEVRMPFNGRRQRQHRTRIKLAKNFDAPATLRANLKHYDPATARLFIQTPYFNSRVRRAVDRWQLIILVDQSGSMIKSVIYSAVTASIFYGVTDLRTHLIAFDTNLVDLSDYAGDPVETLMKVQLGGGTDIGNAVAYASTLIESPRRTMVVIVSDFYEGAPIENLYAGIKGLVESGVTVLGLAALDSESYPDYNQAVAEALKELGVSVGAMTPGELSKWVSERIR